MRKRSWLGTALGCLLMASSGCVDVVAGPAPKSTLQASLGPPPRSACVAQAGNRTPTLCTPEDGSGTFVVGLPEGHGWQRGRWLLLEVERQGLSEAWAAALAVVVEAYADVARIGLLYQREQSLDGARVRTLGNEERARLGKFVGRVLRVDGGRVQLDVGAHDGTAVGDVYVLREAQDAQASIGRVQVREVGELHAWAVVLDADGAAREGQAATFLQGDDEASDRPPVSILVVNFDPEDEQDAAEAKAGRRLAKQVAQALGNAATEMKGITVRYVSSERIRVAGSDAEGHAAAQVLGKRYGADIVVWGAMRCTRRACAHPRFTVVDPDRLRERSYDGGVLWAMDDDAGLKLTGTPPAEPVALAAAMLGAVAFEAQNYGDASYYLGKALSTGVLRGEDELRGLRNLAYSMYIRGQSAGARAQSVALVQRARSLNQGSWESRGVRMLALIDVAEGKVASARAHIEEVRKWAEAQGDPAELAHAMCGLGFLEQQQGRIEAARGFYQQGTELHRRTGDEEGEAAALHQLANLEEQQGRADEARTMYERSLTLKRRVRDVKGEAATLHQLANLEEQQGRVEEARKLYHQALELKRHIGYVRGEAATLHQLANLEEQQGRVEEARELYRQSLELKRRIGYAKGQASTLHELGRLEAKRGRAEEARKLYQQALELHRRIGHLKGEAATLHQLAILEAKQGRQDVARRLYQRSIAIKKDIGDADGEAATLHQVAVLESQEGHVEEARALFRKSLEIKRRTGNAVGELSTLMRLAELDLRDGKLHEAGDTLESTFARARAIGHAEYQARSLRLLGLVNRAKGEHSVARERWAEARDIYHRLQMPAEVEDLDRQLASLPASNKATSLMPRTLTIHQRPVPVP